MSDYFKKILVAFDNSKASQVALKKACNVAKLFHSNITTLFVSKDEKSDEFNPIKEYLYDFSKENNITIEMIHKIGGKVYDVVIDYEKEHNFDLILIGAHGTGGWQSNWIGGNAFKVVSSSNCPVITIRENVETEPKMDYLLPLADSSNTRQKIPYAAEMAKAFNATIHILGISKSDSEVARRNIGIYVKQAEQYFAERSVKYTVNLKFGVKVPETCITQAETVNAGLIMIMTDTESSGLFMDSYSQQLVNTSPIPVMSIHSRDTRVYGASGY